VKWYCLAAAPVADAAAVVTAPYAVAAVGFGSSGIVAGSAAAWLQSMGVAVGTAQSIGAVGAGYGTFATVSGAWAYYCDD